MPSYRTGTLAQWEDYLRELESKKYAEDIGIRGPIAEARGVIQAFHKEAEGHLLAA